MTHNTGPTLVGWKLFRQRKDGTLGPLFINARQRVPVGEWLPAGDHPTKGFAHRPGWHATLAPVAPHLKHGKGTGRVWARVELAGVDFHTRPVAQGGTWVLAQALRVLEVMPEDWEG